MPAVKLSFSLDEKVVRTLRQRAAEERKSVSRYLADLVVEDARRSRDEFAAEGYRVLSADTASFAAAAWSVAAPSWPAWDGEPEPADATEESRHGSDDPLL